MFGRHIRQAWLLDETVLPARPDIVSPLFDPQPVRMTDSQMTLHGDQIHVDAETGPAIHFAQTRVLRPATDV